MTESDAPRRILHIANHTRRYNGNAHAAIDLACAQADLGHEVALCSSGGDFDDALERHGVRIFHLPIGGRSPGLLLAEPRLIGLLRAWKPDIVHAHMVAAALLAWPATRLLRLRLATTVHNAFERSAILMGLGDRVIAVSAEVGRSMHARGISSKRLRVVLNGTVGSARQALPRPAPAKLGRPAIVYVGGLHDRKGVGHLIAAMKRVHAAVPDARLHIVGEGPMEESYRAMAQGCESIVFEGASPDPRPFLLAADIFVLASLADPAPLVISEACEAGCAIVATDVDGIPELLDGGRAGVLTPPANPDRLADAIIVLLRDPAALARARAAASANAARLSVRRVAEETLAAYPARARRASAGPRPSPNARDVPFRQGV